MATKQNLKVIRENPLTIRFTLPDGVTVHDGDPIYFTAKKQYDNDQTDSSAQSEGVYKDLVGVEGNEIELRLEAADITAEPGEYVYDMKLRDTTVLYGKLVITEAVTLRGV